MSKLDNCHCHHTDTNEDCPQFCEHCTQQKDAGEEIVSEILHKSQGHFITYQYGEEDGTFRDDKAIPVGWFKQWLKIAVKKAKEEYGR